MIIKAIKLFNFSIYAGEHVIEPADSSTSSEGSITLIGGMNGRGKTSLLDAILLALYGSRSPSAVESGRSYSSYLRTLINKSAPQEQGAWVELELTMRDEARNISLRIRRSWRATSVRAIEQLQIWKDGSEDSHLAQGWDSYVEELIPVGVASLFFFDGEKIARLAESEETPISVQQAIRSMLGIDLVDRVISDLATIIRRNQSKVVDSETRSELEQIQTEKDRLNTKITVKIQDVASLESLLKRRAAQLQQLQDEYYRQGGSIGESRKKLTSTHADSVQAIAQARADLATLAAGALPLLLTRPLLQRIQDRAHSEEEAKRAQVALPYLAEQAQIVMEKLQRHSVDSDLLDQVSKLLTEKQLRIEQSTAKQILFPISPVGLGQLDDFLNQLANQLELKNRHDVKVLRQLEFEQDQLDRHLLVEVNQDELGETLKKLTCLTQEISQLQQQKTEAEHRVKEFRTELTKIESRLKKLASQMVSTEESERVIKYAAKSQDTLRLLREKLVGEKVASLTQSIGDAFGILAHKSTLVDHIQIDPETLRIALVDSDNRELPKSRLSSGEKQMLAVAILWGLAVASERRLPVIIDTPMGRLDSSHRMNFVTRYLTQASHQVIILSTDTEIVGPYLASLRDRVGRYYLLEYNESKEETSIKQGYFETSEGEAS